MAAIPKIEFSIENFRFFVTGALSSTFDSICQVCFEARLTIDVTDKVLRLRKRKVIKLHPVT